jgi:hypothetical protein
MFLLTVTKYIKPKINIKSTSNTMFLGSTQVVISGAILTCSVFCRTVLPFKAPRSSPNIVIALLKSSNVTGLFSNQPFWIISSNAFFDSQSIITYSHLASSVSSTSLFEKFRFTSSTVLMTIACSCFDSVCLHTL